MSLIGVPALESDLRQPSHPRRPNRGDRAVEPDHPREQLGGQADLLAEARDEAAVTPAERLGDPADRSTTVGVVEMLPRPLDSRMRRPRVGEAARQERIRRGRTVRSTVAPRASALPARGSAVTPAPARPSDSPARTSARRASGARRGASVGARRKPTHRRPARSPVRWTGRPRTTAVASSIGRLRRPRSATERRD